jgi:hypothetical protein
MSNWLPVARKAPVPAPDFSRGSGFLNPRERSVGKLRALALVAALRHGYASYQTDTGGCSFIPTGRLALATELRLSIRIQSPQRLLTHNMLFTL